jgi:hypothetical protein
MLTVWTQKSGYQLASIDERRTVEIVLPTTGDLTGITFSVIAGSLPEGLRLENNIIRGTPFEVRRVTESTFVIRAASATEISDRTFKITVSGSDAPVWLTPEGPLTLQTIKNPARLSKISKVYVDNSSNVTIVTEGAHDFLPGNKIDIDCSITAINARQVEMKDTPYLLRQELGLDVNRVITYKRTSVQRDLVDATGFVKLEDKEGAAFVLDNTVIDFQLAAIDSDVSAGDKLEFFIQDGDGELPPGLILSDDGRITGTIEPILSLDISAGTGFFDANLFDSNPFDFGEGPKTGLDSFLYDSYFYDYFDITRTPRKLNRNYEFYVSVSDGINIIRRKFRIYVVGDDFLRSDNNIMQVGTGTYTADVTYLRTAVWLSGSNLGIKRANNYVTVFLDAFDPNPQTGPIIYELESTNPEVISVVNGVTKITPESPSELPPGLFLDPANGELFGFVPYQPAVTKEYKFTVTAVKYDKEGYTLSEVNIKIAAAAPYGQNFVLVNALLAEDITYLLNESIRIGNYSYRVTDYIPPTVDIKFSKWDIGRNYIPGQYVVNGETYYEAIAEILATEQIDINNRRYWQETRTPLATLKLSQNLLVDVQKGFTITKQIVKSTSEFTTTRASKTFNLSLVGEVDSVISFNTPTDLGTIRANFPSTLSISATTSVPNAVLNYKLVDGNLPPGTELLSSGEIVGKVIQFGTVQNPGLTIFDNDATKFDGGAMTVDRRYTFSVLAQDQFKYSAIVGTFTVYISSPDTKLYSNIYARPYQSAEKRSAFYGLINDTSIFTPNKIYRLGDSNFGLQKDLKMLVYAGIETTTANNYMPMVAKNAAKKRFRLGNVKKAIAKVQGSNDIEYEVIYIEVLDNYENGKISVPSRIKLPVKNSSRQLVNQLSIDSPQLVAEIDRFRPAVDPLTADSDAVFASGRDREYVYPTTISNIRNNIANAVITDGNTTRTIDTEREFLPLWMVTAQDARTPALGYIKAVPLCYCLPGEADYIIDNINNSGFDFGLIDYEIDRFIIDSTIGNSQEQFIKFSNHRFNI